MNERRRFILIIEHRGDGDTFMALKMVLKRLLRTYNFRCVAIRQDNADAAGDATEQRKKGGGEGG